MELFGIPLFYLVPPLVFGPIFFFLLYSMGLRDVVRATREDRERRRRMKEETERQMAVHGRRRRARQREAPLKTALRWAGQAAAYAVFALGVGFLSNSPSYVLHGPGEALVKLSLSHPGKRKEECRRRTREELAKLPPNMRAPMACSRERWPLEVELDLDGKRIFSGVAAPAGLSRDGASSFYEAFVVNAGRHRIAVRMKERGDGEGFDFSREEEVTLAPAQNLVIGFKAARGGFRFE